MIKTIIFDLGKVIVPFDFARCYERLRPVCSFGPEEIRTRLLADRLVWDYEVGAVNSADFAAEVSRRLELNVNFETFCDIWCSIFLPDPLIPSSLLASLRKRHRLLLLSNTNEIHFRMLERSYPLLGHFDKFILSHEVGAAKPSPAIFEETLRQAACRPQECFFTDDLEENVQAARTHGIDAVTFHSLPQLESELRRRGIHWNGAPSAA